jgi:hypothetical protein
LRGSLYTWSNKWDDSYPTNRRWAAGAWVGVVSSSQPPKSVCLRRCRTGRVGLMFSRSIPKQVHNLKYLSRYYSKIFKLYLCEHNFTYKTKFIRNFIQLGFDVVICKFRDRVLSSLERLIFNAWACPREKVNVHETSGSCSL